MQPDMSFTNWTVTSQSTEKDTDNVSSKIENSQLVVAATRTKDTYGSVDDQDQVNRLCNNKARQLHFLVWCYISRIPGHRGFSLNQP